MNDEELGSMEPSDEYLGTMRMFAGFYVPRNYTLCDGRLLNIMENRGLFQIFGIQYGGNGTDNFALPDMRERDAENRPIPFGPGKPLWIIRTSGRYPVHLYPSRG